MPSPFPGMDPCLEQHWRDVRSSLISYARDQLRRSPRSTLPTRPGPAHGSRRVARPEYRPTQLGDPFSRRLWPPASLRSLAVVLRYYPSLAPLAGGQTCLRLLVTDFRGAVLRPRRTRAPVLGAHLAQSRGGERRATPLGQEERTAVLRCTGRSRRGSALNGPQALCPVSAAAPPQGNGGHRHRDRAVHPLPPRRSDPGRRGGRQGGHVFLFARERSSGRTGSSARVLFRHASDPAREGLP
ncbi:MAG: DUF4058 family protein [Planctomycetes bacterium]|nr:DUF4058 family protein [Planctomycetota bacterium]